MTVKGMHYDFKQKLNKIDSQAYDNLRIPEIDWKLNEAQNLFIKMIAEPRIKNNLGFETSQRSIDDIRTIVVEDRELLLGRTLNNEIFATLPEDYKFNISSKVKVSLGECSYIERTTLVQHDDKTLNNSFYNSDFYWKRINIRFAEDGIMIVKDQNSFEVDNFYLTYIRKAKYIHNAEGFLPSGSYVSLKDGTVLTGSQDCELPEHTHSEIVDLAVLLTTYDLDNPNYQLKQGKLNLNKIN